MPPESSNLASQRRLLKALGFGFVETALDADAVARRSEPATTTAGTAPPAEQSAPNMRRPTTRTTSRSSAPPPAPPTPPALAPFRQPIPASVADRNAALAELAGHIRTCTRCSLHHARQHALPGIGTSGARVAFVATMPFAEDNKSGECLQGPVGEMTRKMIAAMKLTMEQVFFTSLVKCRPLGTEPPAGVNQRACQPYIDRQLQLVAPEAIVLFGEHPFNALLPAKVEDGLVRARGRWTEWQSIPVMPTLDLEAIHADPRLKRVVWADLQLVMEKLGIRP